MSELEQRGLSLLCELSALGCRIWADGARLRYKAPAGVMTPERLAALRELRAASVWPLECVSAQEVDEWRQDPAGDVWRERRATA